MDLRTLSPLNQQHFTGVLKVEQYGSDTAIVVKAIEGTASRNEGS
jgi:hypothetical protein